MGPRIRSSPFIRFLRLTTSAMAAIAGDPTCAAEMRGVPLLAASRISLLASHGVTLTALPPVGATVHGLDMRKTPSTEVLEALQLEMAERGFLVFKDQGVLSGAEQVAASEFWGGRAIHSTHGVHPKAPNRHVFRLSNDPNVGING
jgi:taurine dioxygenase